MPFPWSLAERGCCPQPVDDGQRACNRPLEREQRYCQYHQGEAKTCIRPRENNRTRACNKAATSGYLCNEHWATCADTLNLARSLRQERRRESQTVPIATPAVQTATVKQKRKGTSSMEPRTM